MNELKDMRCVMENNLKNEMKKLCDMQIELWNDLRNTLVTIGDSTEDEICAMFRKCFRVTHHEAVLQLVRVKIMIEKIEKM